MSLIAKIEAVLFAASKPVSISTLARALGASETDIEQSLSLLGERYARPESGLTILYSGSELRLASHPDYAEAVGLFVKEDTYGELSRAQLETLTVIAYTDGATRPEIEEIRGVNSALILRNLLVRGLIVEEESADKPLPVFRLSLDALRTLGVSSVHDLPEFETLSQHEHLQNKLNNSHIHEE